MKKLAKVFENQINCFGENTEKYITFTVPIEKEVTKIDNNGEEITKNIFYKLQFIYISRLLQAHCQGLSIIFLMEFIKLNVNTDTMIKNVRLVESNINIVTASLNIQVSKIV